MIERWSAKSYVWTYQVKGESAGVNADGRRPARRVGGHARGRRSTRLEDRDLVPLHTGHRGPADRRCLDSCPIGRSDVGRSGRLVDEPEEIIDARVRPQAENTLRGRRCRGRASSRRSRELVRSSTIRALPGSVVGRDLRVVRVARAVDRQEVDVVAVLQLVVRCLRDWSPAERGDRDGEVFIRRREQGGPVEPVALELALLRPATVVRRPGRVLRPYPPEVVGVVERRRRCVAGAFHDLVDDDVVGPVAVWGDLQLVGLRAGNGIPVKVDVRDLSTVGGEGQVGDARPLDVELTVGRPVGEDAPGDTRGRASRTSARWSWAR